MKTLVVNGASYASAVEGLNKISYSVVEFFDKPHSFGLVLFTGGEDVDPSLYNHTSPNGLCRSNLTRDMYEAEVFNLALSNNIRMAGICRGLQFLNVMNGGSMLHHLHNHSGGYHNMVVANGDIINVNSLHHQMVVPPKGSIVLGWSKRKLSNKYFGDKDEEIVWTGPEIESVYYPKTGCVGVQYHPEIMKPNDEAHKFFWNLCKDLIFCSEGLFLKKYRRDNDKPLLESAKG
jgi:anthranilate/para-aminobenzoate synthase component II